MLRIKSFSTASLLFCAMFISKAQASSVDCLKLVPAGAIKGEGSSMSLKSQADADTIAKDNCESNLNYLSRNLSQQEAAREAICEGTGGIGATPTGCHYIPFGDKIGRSACALGGDVQRQDLYRVNAFYSNATGEIRFQGGVCIDSNINVNSTINTNQN